MTTTSVFAEILKTAPQTDGSLLVYGKATGSDLDLDQQQCDPVWLKRAMPEWFSIGNIRESHDAKRAVGKATEYEAIDGDHMITAKVVDPLSKAKIEAGILTGFSIGIKSPRIMKSATVKNGIITDGQIIEVSLVDRPALPTATLTICKSAVEGWTGSPDDYDAERNLVHCEELTIQGEEVTKADAKDDKKPFPPKKDDEDEADEADEDEKDPKAKKKAATPADMPGAQPVVKVTLDGKDFQQIAREEIEKAMGGLSEALGKMPREATDEQRELIASGKVDERGQLVEKATDVDKTHEPAPGQKCADCGEDGHLACKSVEVEEFDIESTKALVESILKGHDESADIAGAEQAIKQIAQLVISEAKAMADMPAQDCDIHLLMSAVDALRIFASRERAEQAGQDPMMALSAEADKTKGSKYDADEMASMLKSGKAMANPMGDPSYPIADEEDLKNAIKAVGRGSGDHGKIRSHIIKRAKALGKADLLPDDWTDKATEADSTEAPSTEKTVEPDTKDLDISKALTGAFEDEESELHKALGSRIENAIEKALSAYTGEISKTFEENFGARLTMVEKMATPGGPALRRTEAEVKSSRKQDLLALADVELRKADTPGLDRTFRIGYEEKAARLRAEANSL